MILSTVLLLAQSVTGEWNPLPILSFGALFSICTAAVGYGVVKAKTDGTERGFEKWREEMRGELGEIRREARENQNEVRRELGAMREQFSDIRQSFALLQGRNEGHMQ